MLRCNVKIYVPSTYNVDKKIDNAKIVDDTKKLLCTLFGGSTESIVNGAWIDQTNTIVNERVNVIYSFMSFVDYLKNKKTIINHAKKIRDEMKQEAVSIEFNNKLYFI